MLDVLAILFVTDIMSCPVGSAPLVSDLADRRLTARTSYSTTPVSGSRLQSKTGWCAGHKRNGDWIMVCTF